MTQLRKLVPVVATVALLLLHGPTVTFAQESTRPITEKGLVTALTIGGLSSQELIDIIDRRGVSFALTPDTEQQLRAAGATSAVIEAVRAHYHAGPEGASQPSSPLAPAPVAIASVASAATPASTAPMHPSLPENPGVFFREGANWNQLRPESAAWYHEGLMHDLSKGSGGLLHGELTAEIAGTHSPVTMHSPVSFLIHTANGAMLQDYLLIHLHEKHDNRNFKVALGGSGSKDAVDFRAAKVSDDLYEISFTQGTGDYAFLIRSVVPANNKGPHQGQVLTFRILE